MQSYSVILINPVRHPHVNGKGGRAFVKWLTSPEGQGAINAFRLNGEQLFLLRLKKLEFPLTHLFFGGSLAPVIHLVRGINFQ